MKKPKKKWALLYIPYGSLAHSLYFPIRYAYASKETVYSRNMYISREMAEEDFDPEQDRLEVITLERVYKPSIKAWFRFLDKIAKDQDMTARQMFIIDLETMDDIHDIIVESWESVEVPSND